MNSEEDCIAHMSNCSAFASKFDYNGDSNSGGNRNSTKKENPEQDTKTNSGGSDTAVDNGDAKPEHEEEDFSGHVELWNPKHVKLQQQERFEEGVAHACEVMLQLGIDEKKTSKTNPFRSENDVMNSVHPIPIVSFPDMRLLQNVW
jgi:hypothetical protein